MSMGWGFIPMQAPAAAGGTAATEEHVEVIQLITNRALAPSVGDFLAELHNSEVLSDITICSEDGQAIKCHKLVLIRWSAPFRRMLCGDMREAREKDITLHGVDGEVLAAFIRFLYTCHCSIAPEKLVGLCAMADQYDVTLLQQLCMDAIRTHANNHRCCCLFYKAAKEIQQLEIQQLAWEQLTSNLHSLVQQHDVFVQLEFEDVLRLFSRPDAQTAATAAATGDTSQAGISSSAAAAAGPSSAGAAAPAAAARTDVQLPSVAEARAARRQLAAEAAELAILGMFRSVAWTVAACVSGQSGGVFEALRSRFGSKGTEHALPLCPDACRADGDLSVGDEMMRQYFELELTLGQQQPQVQQQQQQQSSAHEYSRQEIAAAYHQTGRPTLQQPRRPEYALFLASMAWLHHLPERQQYRGQLYECFDFSAMRDSELSQMRRNPFVQADPDLKEMLLDAFERRCLDHAQQPVYHMAPMPPSTGWGHPAW